jgi:two-component system cell cycle response regulator DivK
VDNQAFEQEPMAMVVKDDPDLGPVLNTAIEERLQLRALVAIDGLQAVGMAKEEHPNLILVGLHMPYINGFEAIRRIKDDPAISDIPIVAFSNHNWDFHWKNKALALGCEACVNKTMALDELHALVLRFLPTSKTSTRSSAVEKSAAQSYCRDDWGRITDCLHQTNLDMNDGNETTSVYQLASMIERESDFWDDPDAPQTIWMEPCQQQELRSAAQFLAIEEVPLDAS